MRLRASILALVTCSATATVARAESGEAIAQQLAAPDLERLRLHPDVELEARAAEVAARTEDVRAALQAAKGKRMKARVAKAHAMAIDRAEERLARAKLAYERARAVVAWLRSAHDCPLCGMG